MRRLIFALGALLFVGGIGPAWTFALPPASTHAPTPLSISTSTSTSSEVPAQAQDPGERSKPNTVVSDFDDLLAGFAAMPGFEGRFVEEKTLSLLAVPLRSEGRIYFAPPSFLLREMTSPQPQRVLVSASHIRLSGGGREEVIDLASRAEVRPLVESLIWLFTGDRIALESAFRIDFAPAPAPAPAEGQGEGEAESEGWMLRLSPLEAPLSQLISRLVIRGDGLGARQIDVEEVSGDRSEMRILEANPERRFSATELESLFGIEQAAGGMTGPDE